MAVVVYGRECEEDHRSTFYCQGCGNNNCLMLSYEYYDGRQIRKTHYCKACAVDLGIWHKHKY